MDKYAYNLLIKQIERLKTAIREVSDPKETRKLRRRLEGLELLQETEVMKRHGVIV